jgi:putative transposase
MLAGRRFRVEFSHEQEVFAEQVGAVCRAVWNTGLEQRLEYRRRGAWMNYRAQAKELAEAKAEHRWSTGAHGYSSHRFSAFARRFVCMFAGGCSAQVLEAHQRRKQLPQRC